jgi:hypothetical protein
LTENHPGNGLVGILESPSTLFDLFEVMGQCSHAIRLHRLFPPPFKGIHSPSRLTAFPPFALSRRDKKSHGVTAMASGCTGSARHRIKGRPCW